jgi:predicted ATPase/class 3 adenylate cyclase
MGALPSGTVTLLFSDIEGSTALLTRLGPLYADALDAQREILRSAWSTHGGSEMGTEGDSFFVSFTSASEAVAAAVDAQRELASHPWPEGEALRVRIGMHTGTPVPHEDGYVGLDVTRAARIAAAAHGGQVVLSDSTAHLVMGELSGSVKLRDLGSHQLKDIAQPERLYQVAGEGLERDFPPLRTLGSASTLPIPATSLVGRKGELAALTDLLGTPGVRLVSLTGPGGSGKTRLAIEVANRLTASFPDGTYFVPLAPVTLPGVMWTTIGEVLDVPPTNRAPPALFESVKHRDLLLVLDNLEQLDGADGVVADLLVAAPKVVVLATSRSPLHLPAEHEHPVPPLELPDTDGAKAFVSSGAVQLFQQQAQMVLPSFSVSEANAAAVADVCRRLDGLPLAIELVAARSKLLSPRALLTRLDQALDIAAAGRQVPGRQQTLRQAIGWSYDLLNPDLRRFFRQLGVFAGGADLAGVAAVTEIPGAATSSDALELVAQLVDASLVTITETIDGDPRVGLLETIRRFAHDQLVETDELDAARARHALHYLQVAEEMRPLVETDHDLEARTRLEIEHDNLREALDWAVARANTTQPGEAAQTADVVLRMCAALGAFWGSGGYADEGRRWLERAVEIGGPDESVKLVECLQSLANLSRMIGDVDKAHRLCADSVSMWRRLQCPVELAMVLNTLAAIEMERGRPREARTLLEEALSIARASDDEQYLAHVLGDLVLPEIDQRNHQRALELLTECLGIARRRGSIRGVLGTEHNMACLLLELGRAEEAQTMMQGLIRGFLDLKERALMLVVPEDYAAIVAELGEHRLAVRLIGAADAAREEFGEVRRRQQNDWVQGTIVKTHEALSDLEWDAAYAEGRRTPLEEALEELAPPRA